MTGNKIGRLIIVIAIFLCVSIPAYAAETLIFSDTFTGDNGTDLVSHSPDTGTNWQEVVDTAGTLNIQIQSNQARSSTSSSNNSIVYVANPASSVADMKVTATMTALSTGNDDPVGLVLRYQDTSNYYGCMIQTTTAPERVVWFDRRVGGVYSDAIGGDLVNISANDVVSCSVIGTSLEMRVNDAVVVSTTDSSLSAAGKGGIYLGDYPACGTCDIVTGNTLDSFQIHEITSDTERRIW